MTEDKKNVLGQALRAGMYLGIAIVVTALVLFAMGVKEYDISHAALSNYRYLVMALGIYYSLKWYALKNREFKYSKLLWFGILVGFFASWADAFYILAYLKYLDPQAVDRILDLLNTQLPPQYKSQMDLISGQMPMLMTWSTVFSDTFLALVYSLFYAFFIKLLGRNIKKN